MKKVFPTILLVVLLLSGCGFLPPSESTIKEDLVGQTVGDWEIQSITEFFDSGIKELNNTGGLREYEVKTFLLREEGVDVWDGAFVDMKVIYQREGLQWQVDSIVGESVIPLTQVLSEHSAFIQQRLAEAGLPVVRVDAKVKKETLRRKIDDGHTHLLDIEARFRGTIPYDASWNESVYVAAFTDICNYMTSYSLNNYNKESSPNAPEFHVIRLGVSELFEVDHGDRLAAAFSC